MKKTNILLYGEGGSGKSSSTATVFKFLKQEPNLKVRYLMTEANAMDGMLDGITRHSLSLKEGQLAYMVCKPTPGTRTISSKDIANDFNTNFMQKTDAEAMKVKITSADRAKHNAFLTVLQGIAVFKGIDYITKEETNYGDYLKWDENVILVVDSLTACVDYLVDVVKANRVATVISDYSHVQSNLMNKVIIPMTEQAMCSVIMLGHPTIGDDNTVKQPADKLDRITKLYPRTFGQAINNTVISKFSEVIYSYVDFRDNFIWAGKKAGVATSPRKLPRKDNLKQDFSLYPLFGLNAVK